jgi:hypothetical protein
MNTPTTPTPRPPIRVDKPTTPTPPPPKKN